jgi:hypothetical protein
MNVFGEVVATECGDDVVAESTGGEPIVGWGRRR